MDFGGNLNTLKTNILDMYEGVHADVVYTTRFDENSYLSTTYLGKTRMTRETKVKAEEKFTISGQGYTGGSHLSWIFLEHENMSALSVIQLIYIKLYRKKEK